MATHRYSPQEVTAKLEVAQRLEAEGMSVADVCRELKVNELTYLRWYKKYAGLDDPRVTRLRQLEEENAQLRSAIKGIKGLFADLQASIETDQPVPPPLSAVPPPARTREM